MQKVAKTCSETKTVSIKKSKFFSLRTYTFQMESEEFRGKQVLSKLFGWMTAKNIFFHPVKVFGGKMPSFWTEQARNNQ